MQYQTANPDLKKKDLCRFIYPVASSYNIALDMESCKLDVRLFRSSSLDAKMSKDACICLTFTVLHPDYSR